MERIWKSQTLHNKESLRRLLLYLADRTFDGTSDSLKEYTLGLDVFGKPASYDPQADPSVRVAVGKLRQKLEEYYLAEGVGDPILIELPRRHFELRFQPRSSQQAADEDPPHIPAQLARAPAEAAVRRRFSLVIAAGTVCFLAGIAATIVWRDRVEAGAAAPSEVYRFWQPILDSPRPALVSIGTPLFVRFPGARVRVGGDDFDAIRDSSRIRRLGEIFPGAAPQPSYIYTGVGEAGGGFLLSKLFARWHKDIDWRRSNALTWDEIGRYNLIFLGSAKYNPQLRKLPVVQSFIAEESGVANLRPNPGEPSKFLRVYDNDEDRGIVEDFAVVSRLPGLNGRGEIVVLGSSCTEGTLAAVQYVTQPESLRELFARLRGAGEVPRYFEAVIRARFRDMVPVASSYVAHRELSAPVIGSQTDDPRSAK